MSDSSYGWNDQDPEEMQHNHEFGGGSENDFEEDEQEFVNNCDHTDHHCDEECEECSHCDDCGYWVCSHCEDCEDPDPGCDHESLDDDESQSSGDAFEEPFISATRTEVPDDSLLNAEGQTDKPRNHGTYWTLDEDRQLVSRYLNGEDFNEIAIEFERTPGAIQGRLIKLCFYEPEFEIYEPRVDSPPRAGQEFSQREIEILEAYRSSQRPTMESLKALAETLERRLIEIKTALVDLRIAIPVNPETIPHREKTKQPFRSWSNAEKFNLRQLIRERLSVEEVAERLDRTVPSVIAMLCGLGEVKPQDLDEMLKTIEFEPISTDYAAKAKSESK